MMNVEALFPRVLPALFLLCTLSAARAAQAMRFAWREPGATVRLLVGADGSRSSWWRVDFPEECSASTHLAVARLDSGAPLPLRPVVFRGKLVGAEVRVPRSAAWKAHKVKKATGKLPFGFAVYLLEKQEAPRKASRNIPPPAPVMLTRALSKLPTRPFYAGEMTRALTLRSRFPFTVDVPELSAKLPYEKWASPPERFKAFLHWSTELRVEQKTAARFGADLPEAAWFFYVDGRCVAGWKEGKTWGQGGRLSAPISLTKGFHRLSASQKMWTWLFSEKIPKIFTLA